MTADECFEINRRNWDDPVPIHVRDTTGFYQVAAFVAGADTLGPIEAAEIGNVSGKRLLHLQCHFGLDTLSLARRGATVTGLDFSPRAIAAARDMARRTGLTARFIEGNVYDAPSLAPGPFDIVYTTWGTINWLPDVRGWGKIIAAVLAPGGFLYFADGHPSTMALEDIGGQLIARHDWQTSPESPVALDDDGDDKTYTGDPTPLANPNTREWLHPVSAIMTALLDAGLAIEMIHEHEAVPWQQFPMMVEGPDRLYRLPAGVPRLPLGLSLKARRA